MDTFLNLTIEMRDLVLPQSDVSDFVDFPRETVPYLRSGLGWGGVGKGGGSKRKGGSGIGIHM